MKRILLEKQNGLFAEIAKNASLYIPSDVKGKATYVKYTDGVVMSDALNTVRSPKDYY